MKNNPLDSRKVAGRRTSTMFLLLAAASVTFVVAASAASVKSTKPTVTIGTLAGGIVDPAKASNAFQAIEIPVAYEAITHWKPDGTFGPALATSWRYVHDPAGPNKAFEFTLRHNARFADGSLVTAKAVKAWLDYCRTANSPMESVIGKVRSVKTLGKWVVVVHLETPNPGMPLVLSDGFDWGFVVGPAALARAKKDPTYLATHSDGAGQYVVDPARSGPDESTLVPNKYYYNPSAIKFGKVVVKTITQPSTMLAAVESGQLDVAYGDSSTVDAAARAGLRIVHAPSQISGIVFLDRTGTTSPPLADPRVRQALNYAVDRKTITKALFGNYGKPTSEYITLDGFDPKYENYYTYNPAKARSLLAAAGYAKGFTLKMIGGNWGGNILTPLGETVAKYLGDVGVTVEIADTPNPDEFITDLTGGRYPTITIPFGTTFSMSAFYGYFGLPNADLSQHGWFDPVLNKLWLKGLKAKGDAASSYWKQMSARLVTQGDELPIAENDNIYYVSKRIGGVQLTVHEPLYPFVSEWYPK